MNHDAIARFTDEDGDDNDLPPEFATATMGHLLLAQGRVDEARAVFAAALARDPDDADARRGLDAATPAVAAEAIAPQAFVRAIGMSPTSLMVHWSAPSHALSHVSARPEALPLALAITTLRAGATGVLSAHRTVPLDAREGELAVHGLDPASAHLVALGARVGDRLVPFARASAAHTPQAAPTAAWGAPDLEGDAESAPSRRGDSDAPTPELSFEGAYARWSAGLASS